MKQEEREYLQRVAEVGCIVCRKFYGVESPAEIHHLRAGQGMGQRASNFDVIPLCPHHHRIGGWGIALHAGQKEFEKRHASERELLDVTREILHDSSH